jgi:hypothetical protein
MNIQHTAELASANESDLNWLAAGFALGEFGGKAGHDPQLFPFSLSFRG